MEQSQGTAANHQATKPKQTDEIRPLKAHLSKACFDFAAEIPGVMQNWPKPTRMGLGRRLEENVYGLLEDTITITNPTLSNAEKQQKIQEMSSLCDIILVYLRLARVKETIPIKKYSELSEKIVAIGKQIGGFKRYLKHEAKH
jgi:hypothetical protein